MLMLEPTIEFEPSDWMDQKGHSIINRNEWIECWDTSLKRLGITPIYSGSWHVSVDEIDEPEVIKKILNIACVHELSPDNIDNDIAPLSGGYVLFENDKLLFEPHCCCDLGDLNDWKEVIDLESENWHNLSMGHALMSARKIDDKIEIKETPENRIYEPIIEKINRDELQIAISKTEQKIKIFKGKIVPILNEIFNNRDFSIMIAEKLTGQM